MKLRLNDNIIVIAGKDKGKKGKILKILRKQNKIVVEKVNLVTKHIKKTAQRRGERIKLEAPLSASNVMLICPTTKKRTRLGYRRLENGKRERFSKKSKLTVATITTKSK